MIRHTVMFTLRHAKGSLMEKAFLRDADVLATIPEVQAFEKRRQVSGKNEFAFSFAMNFADRKAYDAYNLHPSHVTFVRDRWNKEVAKFLEADYEALWKLAQPFHIIAHRGASGYAPENTMAAFERAVAMGATEVETDVGFTKDGHLLLLHDFTLDRTTNGTGEPERFTLDELKGLDAGSWKDLKLSWDRDYRGEKLITLDELLDRFGNTLTYHVELKKPTPGLIPAVVKAIVRRGLARNVYVFGVEQEAELLEIKRLAPDVRIAWAPERLLASDPAAAVARCAADGFAMIVLNASNQSREVVDLAHSMGVEARSSGISNREKMIAAAEIGCNGMTINWPDWLIDCTRRIGQ